MHLESHATPSQVTPQQRYANLHRAIERGLDSDEIWKELAAVSLHLGHEDEARRCLPRIRNETTRRALQSQLERLGVLATSSADHAKAPAVSDAGAAEPGLREHFLDACHYLLHQRMPALTLVTTLAFPVVIGVGGFLTAGGSWFLLAAIATLPGLCVLGLVGAMSRQILLASAHGESDMPPIPSFWTLVVDARRFFVDLGLVVGLLVGPPAAAWWLGTPWTTALAGVVIGAFFVPMAWTLRQLHGDLDALSPVRLVRAVARVGLPYAGLAATVLLLFVPAALIGIATLGRPVWVQIAIVGPLSVLPLFISARLLGTWIEPRRHLASVSSAPRERRPQPAAPAKGAVAATPRLPKRPAALEHFRAPAAPRIAAKPALARRTAPSPAPAGAPAAAAPRVATKPPSARPAARSAAAAHAARGPTPPAPVVKDRTARAIEGRAPARSGDQPDLSRLPGAMVVTGSDRQRQGAAARRP